MKLSAHAFLGIFLVATASTGTGIAADETLPYKQLEQDVETMKENVLKQKLKLHQLEEAVLFGKLTSTNALITFKNDAEGFFQFVDGDFTLDGKPLVKLTGDQFKNDSDRLVKLLDGEIPAGDHALELMLRFKGQKKGPFSYPEDYTFTISAKKNFTVEPGKTRALEVIVLDRGVGMQDLKQRLAVTFNLTTGS